MLKIELLVINLYQIMYLLQMKLSLLALICKRVNTQAREQSSQ